MPESSPPGVARFPFRTPTGMPAAPGEAAFSPLLPIQLTPINGKRESLAADGLLDTGASVNVLPFGLGVALGAVWPEGIPGTLRLGGNLADVDAHPMVLTARVGDFAPVRLAFAWTRAEQVPLILGQVNFFMEFDVCFYRSRLLFDVRSKHS